ncbi:MAG: DUF354 domain-containing protein [Halanaeroarchaeum sp.]
MTVVFTIQHPAHVHLFRNPIAELEAVTNVEVVVRDKEMAVELLEAYDIDHTVLAADVGSISNLFVNQLRYEFAVWRHVRGLDPTVIVGVGGVTASHVATLTGATSIIFVDNEDRHAPSNKLAVPFADVVCTPRSLESDYGDKQVRYDGFHELAYLHPDRFAPDPNLLERRGIDVDERYFVLRFVGWTAHHDVGRSGFSAEQRANLVSALDELGSVYITSESPLPSTFEEYRLPVEPQHVHHLLYFADVYVGDSGTMATEAAILGTPSIRLRPEGIGRDFGNFTVLEADYDLLYSTANASAAVKRAIDLATDPESKTRWRSNAAELVDDSIDVSAFIVDMIDEYR